VAKISVKPASLKQFLAAMGQFAAGMKITMRDAMLEQAALACQDAARFTPPLPKGGGRGLSDAAKRAGEGAVSGDIRKIFTALNDRSSKSAGGLATNQIAFAIKSNDFGTFQTMLGGGKLLALTGLNPILRKIAGDPNPERAFQKAKNLFNKTNPTRNEYGTQAFVKALGPVHDRVKGKFGGRIKQGQRIGMAKLLVEDKAQLTDYIVKRQQAVGVVKSGWAAALRSLPPPVDNNGQQGDIGAELRKASWIMGKASVAGYSACNFSSVLAQVYVANPLGNVNGVADEADVIALVYGNRVKQMPAQVRYRTQKVIDKLKSK
jgi:hypothetical protein